MSHFDESNSEKSAIEAKGADKRVRVSAKRLDQLQSSRCQPAHAPKV